MSKKEYALGVIPARGGSKRLPRKNLLSLEGIPLLAHTIRTAKQCSSLSRIVLSTDDPETREVGKEWGAEVPFLRPAELAGDTASTPDVLLHALQYFCEVENTEFEYVVLLQATSPLRNLEDLNQAFARVSEPSVQAVVTVCECEHSPLWSNTLPADGAMDNFLRPELHRTRSQDLPIHYRLNGAVYICQTARFIKERTFFLQNGCKAVLMPKERSVDIDTQYDFALAEFLLARSKSKP